MLQDMLFERLSKMEWLMGSSVLFQKRVLPLGSAHKISPIV
jgi:hypothetical protein